MRFPYAVWLTECSAVLYLGQCYHISGKSQVDDKRFAVLGVANATFTQQFDDIAL